MKSRLPTVPAGRCSPLILFSMAPGLSAARAARYEWDPDANAGNGANGGAGTWNTSHANRFNGMATDDKANFGRSRQFTLANSSAAATTTLTHFAVSSGTGAGLPNAFTRGDGEKAYFESGSLAATIVAVPEPGALALTASGGFALLRRRRR